LPNVYVVAPAHVGPLHWLATDEQAARAEAGVRALEAEWILSGEAAVGGEAGEADPTLAVGDARRRFPAEEILLVGGGAADSSLQASLRRLGVPITWVGRRHPRAGTAADCATPCADSPPVEAEQHRSSRSPAPTSHFS